MNLIRAEVERLAARRFVRLMVVLLLAAIAVTALSSTAGTDRPTAGEIAVAEREAQHERLRRSALWQDCRQVAERGAEERGVPVDHTPCDGLDPRLVRPGQHLPGVFDFAGAMPSLVLVLAALLALCAFLVGASWIGAEFTSGGITQLLLWQPRRPVVLGTKLGVLVVAVAVFSVAVTAGYLALFWALAETSGYAGGQTALRWRELLLRCVRGVGLAVLAAALGFALATLGRRTAAAFGAVAAYAVVWEIGGRVVMEVAEAQRPERWMVSSHVVAWLTGRDTFYSPRVCAGPECSGYYQLTWTDAAGTFGLLLTVLLGVAFAAFQRRDLR